MSLHPSTADALPIFFVRMGEHADEVAAESSFEYLKSQQNKRRIQTVPGDWKSIVETPFVELVRVIKSKQQWHKFYRLGGIHASGWVLFKDNTRLVLCDRLFKVGQLHPRRPNREAPGSEFELKNLDGSVLHWMYNVCELERGDIIAQQAKQVGVVYDPKRLSYASDVESLADKRAVSHVIYALGQLFGRPEWSINELALLIVERDPKQQGERGVLVQWATGGPIAMRKSILSKLAGLETTYAYQTSHTLALRDGVVQLAEDERALSLFVSFLRFYAR